MVMSLTSSASIPSFLSFIVVHSNNSFCILIVVSVFLCYSSISNLEGNLETKVFSDPITGLVRRIREIALRRDGLPSYTLFLFVF